MYIKEPLKSVPLAWGVGLAGFRVDGSRLVFDPRLEEESRA